MRFKSVILVLLLLSGLHSMPAVALTCGELPERAESIRAMRDHDAAAGVEKGRELLGRIDEAGMDCPAGRMAVQAAVASNLHILGRNEEAIEVVDAALSLAEGVEDPVRIASVRRTAGVLFWEIGDHDRALEHYLTALEASREAGDVGGAARAAGNIGNLHNTLGNWSEARSFHRQALEGFEEIGWREGIAGTLVNLGALAERMGESYAQAGEEDRAAVEHQANLDYNRRALQLFEELENPRGIAYAADNIARALVELDRVEEALTYQRRSLELRREVGDTVGVINSLITGAEARIAQGQPNEALAILDEASTLVPEGNSSLLSQVVRRQMTAYEQLGDYESAFRRLERLMSLNDAQANEDLAARVEQLQQAFQADQLEQELALQRARAEVSEQRARRQQMISAASIVMVVLLLLVLGLLYSRYRLGRRLSKTLDKAARTDSLTGLSNRRDMTERIDRAILRRDEHDEPSSLIMADIDNFKEVNDTLGHQVGDEVLVHIAGLLGDHLRGVDVAARWGGEEFLILLPGTREAGAYSVSRNLARALDNSPLKVGGRSISMTMTFGVTEIESGAVFNQVIKRVDDAMYAGKAQGRNQVVSASELAF